MNTDSRRPGCRGEDSNLCSPLKLNCKRVLAEGKGWTGGLLTAGDQGVRPDGSGRVAPADGCAERQSTADASPAASRAATEGRA